MSFKLDDIIRIFHLRIKLRLGYRVENIEICYNDVIKTPNAYIYRTDINVN